MSLLDWSSAVAQPVPILQWEEPGVAGERQRAKFHFDNGDANALNQVIKALELAPHDVELLSRAGILAFRAGSTTVAITYFSRMLEISRSVLELIPASGHWIHSVSNAHVRLAQTHERQGRARLALQHYQASVDLLESASRRYGYRLGTRDELPATLASMGSIHEDLGDFASAIQSHVSGLAAADLQLATEPRDQNAKRAVLVAHNNLGQFKLEHAEPQSAWEHFQKGMALATELAGVAQGEKEAQDDLAHAHSLVARYHRKLGNADDALASQRQSLGLSLALSQQHPNDFDLKRRLSVTHNQVAALLQKQGDVDGAIAAFTEGLRLAEGIAVIDRENVTWQSDLAFTHAKLGDALKAKKEVAGALRHYKQSLDIRRSMVNASPGDPAPAWALLEAIDRVAKIEHDTNNFQAATLLYSEALRVLKNSPGEQHSDDWQRAQLTTYWKLSELHEKAGDHKSSLQAVESGHLIALARAQKDPADRPVLDDLASSHNRLGDARRASHNLNGALRSYQESLTTRRPFLLSSTRHAREFALIAFKASRIDVASNGVPERRRLLEEGLEQLERLQQQGELSTEQQAWPATFRRLIEGLK